MKTLLAFIVVACGVIAPAMAAPASKGPQFKTYGGFSPGKKFTFKVTELVSVKTDLGGKPKKCPVPKGIPSFKKNQKVKFVIGKKGELTGPNFSISYESDGITANAYVNKPTQKKPQGDIGEVFKTSTNKPTSAALNFFKVDVKGFSSVVYSVTYILE